MATEDPTGVDLPKHGTYLAHRQIEDLKVEIAGMESMLDDPKSRLEDRGGMVQTLRRMSQELHDGSPPDTTPMQRDALDREEKALRAEIVPAMPSQAEMRKCPPGAIGKHRAFEEAFKAKILRWKNIRRTLNKGNEDPDISNLELYRGKDSTLNMDNAVVPGKDYFIPPNTQAYRDGHDRTFGGGTASQEDVDALKAQIARLEKKLETTPAKPHQRNKNLSDAEKPYTAKAKCDREFRGRLQHHATQAVHMHERKCAKCTDLATGEAT